MNPSPRFAMTPFRGLQSPRASITALVTIVLACCLASTRLSRADVAPRLPKSAVAASGLSGGEPQIEARLLIDPDPSGARVGVQFLLREGWHLYWRNPGDTGIATELEWRSPGVAFGPTLWPAPGRFVSESGQSTSFGYDREVVLASHVDGLPESGEIAVDASVLICRSECIPADFSLTRRLPQTGSAQEREAEARLIERFAQQQPTRPESLGLALAAELREAELTPGGPFELAVSIRSCSNAEPGCIHYRASDLSSFYPELEVDEYFDFASAEVRDDATNSGRSTLILRGRIEEDFDEKPEAISGVLKLTGSDGREQAVAFALPLSSIATGGDEGSFGVLHALLLALLGGFIINGMPCVLPVLGIKICSAAELAQRSPAELRRHGLAYTAGIVLSMLVLAGTVVLLRGAGKSVGWGFQFQEPFFVAAVAAVVVLFALNLFGVFEIGFSTAGLDRLGADAHGSTRSFFDGLLCVVLATPCTAPFLGTAVGFAFAGSGLLIAGIFTAIGLGLASPYALICFVPAWARFVPKPGNWMLVLRTLLGFLLIATAVWLVWILGRSTGVDGVVALLALLVGLAFGVWLLGWAQRQQRLRTAWVAAAATVVLAIGGLSLIGTEGFASEPARTATRSNSDGWQPFDETRIQAALVTRRPVFVGFTADWCITCKLNERMVLSDRRVLDAFDEHRFAIFRADWTQRDEVIRRELARHGRAGVPLYLVYDPRSPDAPLVLPELLSVEGVLRELEVASSGLPGPSDGPALAATGAP